MTRCPDVIIIWLLIELLWTDLVVLSTYKSQKIWSVFLEQARQKSRRKLHQNTAVRLKVSASLHRDHTQMAYRYERSQRQQDSTFLQYLLAQNLHSPRRRQQMLDIIWHRRSRKSCTYQKCSLVGEFALCNKCVYHLTQNLSLHHRILENAEKFHGTKLNPECYSTSPTAIFTLWSALLLNCTLR